MGLHRLWRQTLFWKRVSQAALYSRHLPKLVKEIRYSRQQPSRCLQTSRTCFQQPGSSTVAKKPATTDGAVRPVDVLKGTAWCLYYLLRSWALLFVPREWRYKNVKGWTALVTGGASGAGRLLCVELAKRGCRVVTWDVNEHENSKTVAMVKQAIEESRGDLSGAASNKPTGAQEMVFGYKVDVSDRDEVFKVAGIMKEEVGVVDILVNNAGVVTGKHFLDTTDDENLRTMEINVISHFWTVKAFLPDMIEQNRGHIVTMSSLAGQGGVNRLVDYCASKFAACGFSEALRKELKEMGSDVKSTCVCPYFVDTGMFDGAKSNVLPFLRSEVAVEETMAAILLDKELVLLPWTTNLLIIVKSFLPVKSMDAVEDMMSFGATMEGFKGRQGLQPAATDRWKQEIDKEI